MDQGRRYRCLPTAKNIGTPLLFFLLEIGRACGKKVVVYMICNAGLLKSSTVSNGILQFVLAIDPLVGRSLAVAGEP
jgi:hypothetical protein